MPDIPQAAETALTWGSILKFGLTTGVAAGFFNQSFAWIKETIQRRQKDRRSAKVLALELVELLTRFAQECNEQADCNRYDKDEYGAVGRYSKMPILAPYAAGAEWGLLPARIAAGLRDLRVEVDEASASIKVAAEVNPDARADIIVHQYIVVGHMALELSDRLRRHYGFGRRQRAGEYDFASNLRKQFQRSYVGPVRRAWRRLWNSSPVFWMRRRSRHYVRTLRQTRTARSRA